VIAKLLGRLYRARPQRAGEALLPARRLMADPVEHRASSAATKAWKQIQVDEKEVKVIERRSWPQWETVGSGLLTGRSWAKRAAGIPESINQDNRLGRAYNEKFSQWLIAYDLADIDQAVRSNLFKIMDSPEIRAWHRGLPDKRREKLNNPTAIANAWKAANAQKTVPEANG
jgi:hypothetical protein